MRRKLKQAEFTKKKTSREFPTRRSTGEFEIYMQKYKNDLHRLEDEILERWARLDEVTRAGYQFLDKMYKKIAGRQK